MAGASLAANDKGILLEAGTNEVEILSFRVGGQRYGVNVAKVREVLGIETVTALPESHAAVDGMVRIRGDVVMLVNLMKFLDGDEGSSDSARESSGWMLLLEFNQQMIAFRVDEIDRIVRASWKQSSPMPEIMGLKAPVTSVVLLDNELLPMLDFESIGASIGLHGNIAQAAGPQAENANDARATPIIYAEDSRMISQMIYDSLTEAGFSNVRGFSDGHEAWEYLSSLTAEGGTPEDIRRQVGCMVTDVEMPRIDGLTLTRRIRQHNQLRELPIIIFSSLVSKDNEKKGNQVGATAQVAKPKYDQLIEQVTSIVEAAC